MKTSKEQAEKILGVKLEEKEGRFHYGGSLYLEGTQITSLPEGLTVGGSLDLRGTQITSLPDNLTVRGSLDLRGTQITSLPEGLTVGGSLYLEGTQITDTSKVIRKTIDFFEWRNKTYIKADGVFSKVISHKGNVYKISQIGENKERYLLTDGNGKWSHGDTLKEAKDDLIFKIGDRDKSSYSNLTLDSILSFEESIEAYRVITGACSAGTKMFVKSLSNTKDKYTIAEMIELTKGQYGNNVFKSFFI